MRIKEKYSCITQKIAKISPKKQLLIDLITFFVMFCLILLSIMWNHYVSILSLIIGLLYILIFGTDKSLPFLFSLLPISPIFKFTPTLFSFFLIMEVFYLLLILLKSRAIPLSKNTFVLLVVYFVITLFSTLLGGGGIKPLIGFYIAVLFFGLSVNSVGSQSELKLGLYYVFGLIVASIVGLFISKIPNMLNYVFLDSVSIEKQMANANMISRYCGIFGDPNIQACYSLFGLLILFSLYNSDQIKHYLFYPLFYINIAFGLLTKSKTFLILLIVIIVYYSAVFIAKKRAIKAITICGSLAMITMIGLLASQTIRDIVSDYFFRFFIDEGAGGDTLNNITTGRSTIWVLYINDLFTSPKLLFGYGLYGGISSKLSSHNSFIQMLYMGGIVGTFFFFLMVHFLLRIRGNKKLKSNASFVGYIIIFSLEMMSLELITFDNTYFFFLIMLASLAVERNNTLSVNSKFYSRQDFLVIDI